MYQAYGLAKRPGTFGAFGSWPDAPYEVPPAEALNFISRFMDSPSPSNIHLNVNGRKTDLSWYRQFREKV
jgi:hypothetical protein